MCTLSRSFVSALFRIRLYGCNFSFTDLTNADLNNMSRIFEINSHFIALTWHW
ncbi:MAG: pentapeptide repeat-containing protein [Bacteroidetes bacterium]|nr:pentapeptide repeat-containing protein [Bacteroidota bacterium]